MSSFGPIAPHYDRLMSQVPYDMWAGYYRLLLARIDHDPESLLDVCCGTGTLSELLSKEGYVVVGVDISEQMIERARVKAVSEGLDIEYHVTDIAQMDLGQKFDAAYSFYDSLNYITDPDSLREGIRRVAKHLKDGGSFIFDVNTDYAFEAKMFDQEDLRKKTELKYRWKGDYDSGSRIIKVNMEFWADGEYLTETHVQRAYSDDELKSYLREAGFQHIEVLDSYTLDPPRDRSDRLHYIAQL